MDIFAVARRAGLSTATVSRVLNGSDKVREATAARVKAAIADLGYMPNPNARTLRTGRSNLLGVIVSDIRNPFFPDLIEHFESLAAQHGQDVITSNTQYSSERLLSGVRRFLERGVDGLAILTSEVSPEVLDLLRSSTLNVVLLNQPDAAEALPTVIVDYEKGFAEALSHLTMLGHRRVGFVAGPHSLSSARRRRAAFLAAVRSCNVSFRDEWILEGDHRLTGGRIAAETYFSMQNAPTAMICSNDMTALGFMETASRLGKRLPEDVSLVGFDDLFVCEVVHPALTTLHLSRREIATRAFFALQMNREQRQAAPRHVIYPFLVPRASTALVGQQT